MVGTNDKFTLNIVVHNYGEDAYESMLYLEIPEDINLVHVKTVSTAGGCETALFVQHTLQNTHTVLGWFVSTRSLG